MFGNKIIPYLNDKLILIQFIICLKNYDYGIN